LDNQNLNLATSVADNGGPTQTLAVESGSFAIVAGSWDASVSTDQRGFTRSNPPTIGAYEYFTNTWTGAVSSTWSNNANWSRSTIPVIGVNVEIPNVATAPVISGGNTAICNDLTVNTDASLTINLGASFITNGTITKLGTIEVNDMVSYDSWYFISSPVAGAQSGMFEGYYLQTWDESAGEWNDVTELTGPLTPLKGFGLYCQTSAKPDVIYITYTGTPNTGDQSIGITYNATGTTSYKGANLLGNPYPSYIDWDLVTGYGAKYTWRRANESYDAYTAVTGYGDGSQFLNPMEGFFIVTESTGTFDLDNAMRTNDNSKKSAKGFEKGLVLTAHSGEFENTLYLVFDETASENFELANDAWKLLSGTPGLAEIYSMNSDGKLSVDVRPESESIQLGFVNDEAGIYNIAIKEIADISTTILEDTKTGTFHNLLSKAYEFAWNPDMDDEQRFKLHFKSVGINENQISESNILIYAANNEIIIKNVTGIVETDGSRMVGTGCVSLTVTDMTGRIVLQQNISESEMTAIPVNLKTGVYVVIVRSGSGSGSGACSTGSTVPLHKTEKIFIK